MALSDLGSQTIHSFARILTCTEREIEKFHVATNTIFRQTNVVSKSVTAVHHAHCHQARGQRGQDFGSRLRRPSSGVSASVPTLLPDTLSASVSTKCLPLHVSSWDMSFVSTGTMGIILIGAAASTAFACGAASCRGVSRSCQYRSSPPSWASLKSVLFRAPPLSAQRDQNTGNPSEVRQTSVPRGRPSKAPAADCGAVTARDNPQEMARLANPSSSTRRSSLPARRRSSGLHAVGLCPLILFFIHVREFIGWLTITRVEDPLCGAEAILN